MTKATSYIYTMSVKLSQIKFTKAAEVFPSVEDFMVSSVKFTKFEEAVASTNAFVNEVTQSLNAAAKMEKFKMLSEINPAFSNGQETLTKTWGSNEIAKVWIIDKIKHESQPAEAQIVAIGLAQLAQIEDPAVMTC